MCWTKWTQTLTLGKCTTNKNNKQVQTLSSMGGKKGDDQTQVQNNKLNFKKQPSKNAESYFEWFIFNKQLNTPFFSH